MDHKRNMRMFNRQRTLQGKEEKIIEPGEVEAHNFQNPQVRSPSTVEPSNNICPIDIQSSPFGKR